MKKIIILNVILMMIGTISIAATESFDFSCEATYKSTPLKQETFKIRGSVEKNKVKGLIITSMTNCSRAICSDGTLSISDFGGGLHLNKSDEVHVDGNYFSNSFGRVFRIDTENFNRIDDAVLLLKDYHDYEYSSSKSTLIITSPIIPLIHSIDLNCALSQKRLRALRPH